MSQGRLLLLLKYLAPYSRFLRQDVRIESHPAESYDVGMPTSRPLRNHSFVTAAYVYIVTSFSICTTDARPTPIVPSSRANHRRDRDGGF
jgi:hypothetical protein